MDGNSSSGFSGSLDLEDRHQEWHDAIKGAWDWFESVPFYRMKPGRNLASNGYALAEEGVRYAIYIPDGKKEVELDLRHSKGKYTLRWYNPVSMEYAGASREVSGGQPTDLGKPPGDPSHDWIALLERMIVPVF
jgi:hypothetical protein